MTTVAYKLGPDAPLIYALEGSVAVAGSAVRWLRDNLGIISSTDEVQRLAMSVKSTHGVYFVPAFSGLYAPYWESSARGVICGLTQFTTKEHIARATLESVCYQVIHRNRNSAEKLLHPCEKRSTRLIPLVDCWIRKPAPIFRR